MPAYVFDKKTNELVKVAGNAANADLKDMNVYSTEEKIVGTWIDGKPIYRKVVTGLGNTYDNWNVILLDANVHADKVIYCNMVSNTKTGNEGSVSTSVLTLMYADGTVHVKNLVSNTDSNKVVYVVEYTKTTD